MSRQQRLLQRDLSSEDGVETASGVMVERKMSLEKGYRRALAKAFQTHPNQVDFTKPDEAIGVINAWVSDHTAGIQTEPRSHLTSLSESSVSELCLLLSLPALSEPVSVSSRIHPRVPGVWISV